ncbi:MAG TPA: tetratricopeptide repeat protein, partial [Gemmata sp.]|nr:tetratricopeptide repeat protein [Gemmata sp.]
MNQFRTLVFVVLACALWLVPARADDPPKKLAAEQRNELRAKMKSLNDAGLKAYRAGRIDEAEKAYVEGVEICRRLYPSDEYPGGHPVLANSIHILAMFYLIHKRYADAEPLCREAFTMYKRVYQENHRYVDQSLNNLAFVYQALGKYADAEPLYKDALALRKHLHKGDHPDVAQSLNNLAFLYRAQGQFIDAEPLYVESLAMRKRLHPRQDHPEVALGLGNLAALLQARGQYAHAEPLCRD